MVYEEDVNAHIFLHPYCWEVICMTCPDIPWNFSNVSLFRPSQRRSNWPVRPVHRPIPQSEENTVIKASQEIPPEIEV